jgi:hypothetical protein
MEVTPLARSHASTWADALLTLCVDVINGWSLIAASHIGLQHEIIYTLLV